MTFPLAASGMATSLSLGLESSPGVMVATPTANKIPVSSPAIAASRASFLSTALTGKAGPRQPRFGKQSVAVAFTAEANEESLAMPFKCVFGSPVSSGVAGAYEHQYVIGPAMPSIFVEEAHTDIGQYLLSNGVFLGGFTLSFTSQGLMDVPFTGMGLGQSINSATAVTGALVDKTTYTPFSYMLCEIKQGGTLLGYAQTGSVVVNRNLASAPAMDGTDKMATIYSAIATINGTLTCFFVDAALYTMALDPNTDTSLEFWLPSGGGHGLYVNLGHVVFEPMTVSTPANGGLVTATVKFTAFTGSSVHAAEMWSKYITSVTVIAATNDQFVWKVDAGGPQTITLTSGSRTLAQLQTQLSTLTGTTVTAEVDSGETGGTLRFVSIAGTSVQLDPSSTCATLLGMDTAVHSSVDSEGISISLFNSSAGVV